MHVVQILEQVVERLREERDQAFALWSRESARVQKAGPSARAITTVDELRRAILIAEAKLAGAEEVWAAAVEAYERLT